MLIYFVAGMITNYNDNLGGYPFTGYPLLVVFTSEPLPVIDLRVAFTGFTCKKIYHWQLINLRVKIEKIIEALGINLG